MLETLGTHGHSHLHIQKRRAILVDTLICVFLPAVFIALRE